MYIIDKVDFSSDIDKIKSFFFSPFVARDVILSLRHLRLNLYAMFIFLSMRCLSSIRRLPHVLDISYLLSICEDRLPVYVQYYY